MATSKKTVISNNIGKHCDLLVDDFFNFCDGKPELVKIIDIRDIDTPMPPELEQMRKAMARCNRAWINYCKFVGLSLQSENLFTNRVKAKWQKKEQQQQQLQARRQDVNS